MQGYSCHYQNGFDAQGMWVEVNEEKSLGLNGKPEILEYGLDKFTTKCMERVNYYANEITNQSIRMGQFMDWDNSYFTNSDSNILANWYFLKVCNENGWIIKKNRPMAWCPRCGTSLSEHEMNGAYHDVVHTAVFIKLPVKDKDFKMIAWTTTPWTLSANVALAVNPNLDYALVLDKDTNEKYVLGKERLNILKCEYEILEEFKGDKLVGLEYETCFPDFEEQNFSHKVVAWEDVDATEGSCVVHIAPGCGAEDFDLGLKYDLPQICPINDQGVMLDNTGFLAGKKTTEVTELVCDNLKAQNKLLYSHKYKHSYPFCWRCKTDLVYKLISTWFIKMDDLRPKLIKALDDVVFQPEYSKKRMIDWLNNMGDWNISRARFYGLPLPFYVCEKCGKVHILGSMDELRQKAVNPEKIASIPHLHRPYIDEIEIKCDNCGANVKRIPEVGDCWLDAGITPFSTKKYFTDKKFFEENFPSDYVCEMVEQVKLWFFFTLVTSVTLTGKAPYKKVVTYQYVRDENGNEFHKSGGNSLDCDQVADKTSADAIRYLYASANPTLDVRFGYSLTDEVNRKLLGFWNTYTFFNTYAVLDNPDIASYKPNIENMQVIDRWLLSRKEQFVSNSIENYNNNTYYNIVKDFELLVDDISNFYIRVNRKRFWKSNSTDQMDAYYTLYHTLKACLQIMAPIIPFMTDYMWNNLVCEIEKSEVASVHLSNFPTAKAIDEELIESVNKARDIIYLAQKLRNENQIKVKQPLAKMFLKCDDEYKKAVELVKQIVLDELNIKEIEYVLDDNRFNTSSLVVNFKTAGAVLKSRVNELKNALLNLSEEEMQKAVNSFDNNSGIEIAGFDTLAPTLFEKKLEPKKEFAVASLDNTLVALDINLTQDLIDEGNLREIIRQLQVSRKDAGFEIENRITLYITAKNSEINDLINKNIDFICKEVLALEFKKQDKPDFETDVDVAQTILHIELTKIK